MSLVNPRPGWRVENGWMSNLPRSEFPSLPATVGKRFLSADNKTMIDVMGNLPESDWRWNSDISITKDLDAGPISMIYYFTVPVPIPKPNPSPISTTNPYEKEMLLSFKRDNGRDATATELEKYMNDFDINTLNIVYLRRQPEFMQREWFIHFFYRDNGRWPSSQQEFAQFVIHHGNYRQHVFFIPEGLTQDELTFFKKCDEVTYKEWQSFSLYQKAMFGRNCPEGIKKFNDIMEKQSREEIRTGLSWITDPFGIRTRVFDFIGIPECNPSDPKWDWEKCKEKLKNPTGLVPSYFWIIVAGVAILVVAGTTGYAVHEVRGLVDSNEKK